MNPIHEQIRAKRKQLEKDRQVALDFVVELDREIVKLQKDCPHDDAVHGHYDSYESWTECDVCGGEVKRTGSFSNNNGILDKLCSYNDCINGVIK